MDGFMISKEVYDFIVENLKVGSRILELGSGKGTNLLSMYYHMFSVEHNRKYLNLYKSTYIYAPIKNGWYDIQYDELPDYYNCLLIDGPPGNVGRMDFIKHYKKFDLSQMVVVDDTHRQEEYRLSKAIAKILGKEPIIINSTKKQSHAYL